MGRRRSEGSETSLDSLMDTLTNVVGILLVLLAGLQLDVSTQVQRIQGVDPTVTEAALNQLRLDAADAATERSSVEEQARESDPRTIETRLEEMLANIDRLKKELASPLPPVADPASLQAKVDKLKQSADEAEKKLQQAEEDIAQRRARLSEIRPQKEPPARVVHLPNPRAVPEGLIPAMFVCKGNRVSAIDVDAATARAVEVIRQEAAISSDRCDCEKAVRVFENQKIGNEEFRLRLRDVSKIPYLWIEPIDGKGTIVRQARRPSSPFGQALGRLNPAKQYARFLVWPDSFEVYLVARAAADDRGIAAGWQPFEQKQEWLISLGGHFKCKDWVEPPPAPPAPPQKPGKSTPGDAID